MTYDDCPTECVTDTKRWDWRRNEFCDECPHKQIIDLHRTDTEAMLSERLGDEARFYKINELRGIVYEVGALEDANREQLGAKDYRLLSLYRSEKAKYDKQQEQNRPKPN